MYTACGSIPHQEFIIAVPLSNIDSLWMLKIVIYTVESGCYAHVLITRWLTDSATRTLPKVIKKKKPSFQDDTKIEDLHCKFWMSEDWEEGENICQQE